MSQLGHFRPIETVRDESALPPTAVELMHRGER